MNIHFLSPGENRKHGQTLKRYSERCLCPLQLSLVCHKPILGMRSCGHRQTNVQVLGDALKHWLKKTIYGSFSHLGDFAHQMHLVQLWEQTLTTFFSSVASCPGWPRWSPRPAGRWG